MGDSFLRELKELLEKHNASITVCGSGEDCTEVDISFDIDTGNGMKEVFSKYGFQVTVDSSDIKID